jgi:hypothetical protein
MEQSEDKPGVSGGLTGLAQAPEFFVEGYAGATMRDGVAKLNFFSYVHDPAQGQSWPQARVVLAIPLEDLSDIVRELNDFLLNAPGAGAP